MVVDIDPDFEALLEFLRDSRGFDFTGYKRASLMRRVSRRISEVQVDSYADYLDYLQVRPSEFVQLFNTILINVTSFFRDAAAWEHLRADLLPRMLADRGDNAQIRAWSAGCATGPEAYTIAMVLAEVAGIESFLGRVKIYATDVDEEALAYARAASYTPAEVRGVPPELLERYFEARGGRFDVRKDLRRCVIFGRNDLVQDAPISRVDLLACRNTLMYFNAELQGQILSRLHFALADDGAIVLGKAEMLLSHGNLFTPTDPGHRVFRKRPRPAVPTRPPAADQTGASPAPTPASELETLRDLALHATPVAQLVIGRAGQLVTANSSAETMFGVSARDIGRLFQDLEISYRPVELRSSVAQAQADRRPVWVREAEWVRPGGVRAYLDVQVVPLIDPQAGVIGATILLADITHHRTLKDELGEVNRQLEAAYEELQSTNEELETTNEELQSTVEELETTNEELQSTNEELETMNEELQSTNDEFALMNDEMRDRSGQLDALNLFMESILTSLPGAVIVVDRDLRVQIWNRHAEEMWGVRQDEVSGELLLRIDVGLPLPALEPALLRVLAGAEADEVMLDAVNRRGRPVRVRTVVSPLRVDDDGPTGVILHMDAVAR